ncbi:hypothetical protein BJ165DRAFT_1533270 [Panaeolus papilionaceus]|nr:hypothetical protein BJ165DRAFT_1533270 [Panaeolus papilionaceus]
MWSERKKKPTSNTIPPPAIVRSQSVASVVQIKPEAVDDLPVPNQAPSTPPAIAPACAPTEAPALVDVDIPTPDAPPAYIGKDIANFFNLPNGANNRVQGAPEVAHGVVYDSSIDALNAHAGNLGLRRAGEGGGVMCVLGKHRMQQMLLLQLLTKKKT